MDLIIQENCEGICWETIRNALKEAGMGYYTPEMHRLAFENSFAVAFIFHDNQLVGFGRALCDGAYQAGIYDIVVVPAYQGKGIGRIIMDTILPKIAHCNIILYANPGKEAFYDQWGFRILKTGMGKFLHPAKMAEKGISF